MGRTNPIPAKRSEVVPLPCRWRVEWHAEVDSTMDVASRLAETGAPAGTVVAANFQRAGRGTHGREWNAPPGSCLMFTAIVKPQITLDRLPLLPLDVARLITGLLRDVFALDAVVSPPNDIEINGRKICGILCASRITGERLEWVLCGVGLNTFMTKDQLPQPDATSLAIAGAQDIPDHPQLLEMVLETLIWLVDPPEVSCARYVDKPIL